MGLFLSIVLSVVGIFSIIYGAQNEIEHSRTPLMSPGSYMVLGVLLGMIAIFAIVLF